MLSAQPIRKIMNSIEGIDQEAGNERIEIAARGFPEGQKEKHAQNREGREEGEMLAGAKQRNRDQKEKQQDMNGTLVCEIIGVIFPLFSENVPQ